MKAPKKQKLSFRQYLILSVFSSWSFLALATPLTLTSFLEEDREKVAKELLKVDQELIELHATLTFQENIERKIGPKQNNITKIFTSFQDRKNPCLMQLTSFEYKMEKKGIFSRITQRPQEQIIDDKINIQTIDFNLLSSLPKLHSQEMKAILLGDQSLNFSSNRSASFMGKIQDNFQSLYSTCAKRQYILKLQEEISSFCLSNPSMMDNSTRKSISSLHNLVRTLPTIDFRFLENKPSATTDETVFSIPMSPKNNKR